MNTPQWLIGSGEYDCWIAKRGQSLFNAAGGLPSLVSGQPSGIVDVKGCLHHQTVVDNLGNLYLWGQSAAGETGQPVTYTAIPTLVAKDINGNLFGSVKQAVPYCNGIGGNGVLILKTDGTVWIMGNTQTAMRGDGTAGNFNDAAPVQVSIPATITKICAGIYCAALDMNGNVWTWGADASGQYWKTYVLGRGVDNPDATRPAMMALPSPAADICAGGFFNYAILKTGSIVGWAYYPEYLTGSPTASAPVTAGNTPVLLDKLLNLPQPIAKLFMSTVATYAILTDGTLWSWGDNACGACGNGVQINFATYKTPYAWDWGRMELPQAPVHIGVGLTFVNVATGLGDVFYAWAEDSNGNLYSWGRNKGGTVGNGEVGPSDQQSSYPNSWDVPWMTPINPFALTAVVPTNSPASPAPTAAGASQASAGPAQTITGTSTQLVGSATGAPINYWLWTQVSGPAGASPALIVLPSSQNPVVKGLIPGVYVFQLQTIDNNWSKSKSTVMITVQAAVSAPPPIGPRVVTDLKVLFEGVWVDVKLADAKITFSDGATQG